MSLLIFRHHYCSTKHGRRNNSDVPIMHFLNRLVKKLLCVVALSVCTIGRIDKKLEMVDGLMYVPYAIIVYHYTFDIGYIIIIEVS